jgi:hypothetical protein
MVRLRGDREGKEGKKEELLPFNMTDSGRVFEQGGDRKNFA